MHDAHRPRRVETTSTTAWVFGGTYAPTENNGTLEIVPDRDKYAAGQTAHLVVRAPFAGGRGLLSVERQGIIDARAVDFDGNVGVVDVPITADDVPALRVQIALQRGRATDAELTALLAGAGTDARRAADDDVGRPQRASREISLTVDDAPKRLTVDVRPDYAVHGPGDRMGIDLTVRDSRGQPRDAEVSVMLVDDGVLSLLGYHTPDPVTHLHMDVESASATDSVFAHLVRRRPVQPHDLPGNAFRHGGLGTTGTGWGGGGAGEGAIGLGNIGTMGHGSAGGGGSGYGAGAGRGARRAAGPGGGGFGEGPLASRARFATTAFWAAAVRTDAQGHAHIDTTLPDNLTTFRIMAVAVGRDDQSGHGEATVQVRKTVLLRPTLPRFATWG